jgi:hypothetical protein
MADILSTNALAGVRIGISVSESPDLGRLGLLEGHFRLALGEIARSVLLLGGNIAYGGYLDPDGYTAFLRQELEKYGRRDRPLMICLAWQEHRKLPLSRLDDHYKDLGLYGEIVCLDPEGREINPATGRGEAPEVIADPTLRARALTALRQYMTNRTQGRVLIGGKRHGFQGILPGLMEEALMTLELGKPLYLAGGFGGVTADVSRALRVDDGAWLSERSDAEAEDPRLIEGRNRLSRSAAQRTWKGLKNGLSDDENCRLAASYRPSDIAALVSLGLGRLNLKDQRTQTHDRHTSITSTRIRKKGRPDKPHRPRSS